MEFLPAGDKLANSMFSSITTRHAGFNTLDYSVLQPPTLVFVVLMMYISVSPVTITLRTSDIHSLADVEKDISGNPLLISKKRKEQHMVQDMCDIYEPKEFEMQSTEKKQSLEAERPTVLYQSRMMLTSHIAYLCVLLWIICFVESKPLDNDPGFSIFKVIFEVHAIQSCSADMYYLNLHGTVTKGG